MKRTNLVLDDTLLEEARRLSGERTQSATVNRALADYVPRVRARRILSLRGSGAWAGDLGQMRGDSRRLPALVPGGGDRSSVVLVDTSGWIEVLRRREPLDIEAIVDFDEVVTCPPVVQELLQGIRDERAFKVASEAMGSLPIVESPMERDCWELAVDL
jgi:Arc/MetJ family transcription regulator